MTDLDKIEKCEFGNGLTYCLGMFLAHAEKLEENKKVFNNAGITDKNQAVHMWMNASSDHLYGLYIHAEAPFSLNLQKRILSFRSKVLNWGHGSGLHTDNLTEDDVYWAIGEAKELLRLIDKAYGMKTFKAEFD